MTSMRKDLAEQGMLIPCIHPDGTYLSSFEVEASQYLGFIDPTDHVLLLLENGELALVYSIDLE